MNEKESNIIAVVVTYNRKDLIRSCIDSLLQQTTSVRSIIVVDNASTDGTSEMMQRQYGQYSSIIECLRLDKNEGCTGGFHEGVKRAIGKGADWVWLLDDDVAPLPTCLAALLEYSTISKCIHPSKVDIQGKEFIGEALFDPATGTATFMNNISFKNGKDFALINIGCFEGMLIHKDIIVQIGYPDKKFFMVSDDMMYGFLASLYTNVTYIKNAVIKKLLPLQDVVSATFLYYAVRNQFLVKEYLKKYQLYNRKRFSLYFLGFIISAATKQAWRNKSLKTPLYVLDGIIDGINGKFYQK